MTKKKQNNKIAYTAATDPYVAKLVDKPADVTVITFNGKTELKNQCRSINGKYYKLGDVNVKDSGDCFQLPDGIFYRLSGGKIRWDYSQNKYNLVDNMMEGYVPNLSEPIGYFTPSPENMLANDGFTIMNEETIRVLKMKYDFTCGKYGRTVIAEKPIILRSRPTYHNLHTNIYGLGEYDATILKCIGETSNETLKNTPASDIDKYFQNYKFGLEIETDGGWFPEKLYFKYGSVPLKDGSIKGSEITTIPLPGKLHFFGDMFDDLATYTMVTSNNSLHINLSGFNNTPEFRVALYSLYYRLQQEIQAFIPAYKRSLQYLISKEGGAKDHCAPMENLGFSKRFAQDPKEFANQVTEADIEIFKWLNEGVYDGTYNIKTRKHIKHGQAKWEFQNRYYALNLMPLYFGGHPATTRIEYRVHSGTVNKYKAVLWMLICASITKFVENNIIRILCSKDKITLDDVIIETIDSPELANYILSYISSRQKENLPIITNHRNDIYGCEFTKDSAYKFAMNNFDLFSDKKRTQL